MQERNDVEHVENPPEPTGSAPSTLTPTVPEVVTGGAVTEQPTYEYEFSLQTYGSIMFIHLWDTNDKSACERVTNRNLEGQDINYNPETGNGFIDDCFGNHLTFRKKVEKRSFTHPDFGNLNTEEPIPTDWFARLQAGRRRKPQPQSADSILAG